MRILIGGVVLFGLAGCDLVPRPSVTTTSGLNSSIVIECRGDPPLAADVCRAVGDDLLEGALNLLPRVARLVIDTTRRGNARCAAEYLDDAGRPIGTASMACLP